MAFSTVMSHRYGYLLYFIIVYRLLCIFDCFREALSLSQSDVCCAASAPDDVSWQQLLIDPSSDWCIGKFSQQLCKQNVINVLASSFCIENQLRYA